MLSLRILTLLALLSSPKAGPALEVGDRVDDVQLPAAAGGQTSLLAKGAVNVLVFAKTGHPHCSETLRDLASREGQIAGVHWVAIFPGDTPLADARAMATECGIKMPILLDPGDALYGKLGVKLHPTILVVDKEGKLAAWEPFREINYGDRLMAQIRFTLGEISAAQLAEAQDPKRSDTHSDPGAAKSHTQFAQKLLEMGALDQALSEVQKSLALSPSSQAYLMEGKVLVRQGKCGDAAKAFEVAERLEPKNGEVVAEKSRPCPPKGARVQ
ncbi:MAG TPA: redoxin domain-containing protein [Anaeromyxobacter sp.]|nr:redoxin domain-containing protein [Anaeromyxobacter sp.]